MTLKEKLALLRQGRWELDWGDRLRNGIHQKCKQWYDRIWNEDWKLWRAGRIDPELGERGREKIRAIGRWTKNHILTEDVKLWLEGRRELEVGDRLRKSVDRWVVHPIQAYWNDKLEPVLAGRMEYHLTQPTKTAIGWAIYLLLPLLLVLATEAIHRGTIGAAFSWGVGHDALLLQNYVLVLAVFSLFAMVLRWNTVAIGLTAALVLIPASVSMMKVKAIGVPLVASDLNIGLGALGVADESNLVVSGTMLAAIVFLILLCVLMHKFPVRKPARSQRFLIASSGALVLALVLLGGSMVQLGADESKVSYDKNGFLLGFVSDIYDYAFSYRDRLTVSGDTYSKETMDEIVKAVRNEFALNKNYSEIKPNIITIMSESFFDITKLKKLKFSEDPIPNYHRLSQDYTSGSVVVSTFGGGTANVEFEYLTGFSKKFLAKEGAVYQNYINHEIPSLPWYFKSLGYETTALHTYKKEFYDRDKVYPLLGFDQFIGREDLKDPEYEGPYVSDSELTRIIIDQFKQKTNPLYLFAVSMENHQPYTKQKYPEHEVKLLNTDLDEETKDSVEAYVHGVHDADRALGELIDYFETVKEPTVIVFFGDHQPSIGKDFGIYTYSGELQPDEVERTPEELRSILTTPFLIWSNFELEKAEVTDIGSNFLGNYVLSRLHMDKPKFYQYLDKVYQDIHYFSRKDLFIDGKNQLYGQMPEQYKKMEDVYRLLEYDMLLGEQYSKELFEMPAK